MGTMAAAGECVVDLYAGVGYYTLPFLIHGKASLVHACEWNDNSVMALRHNLTAAGIDTERCQIHHGDNRLKSTVAMLAGLADRVSLGLLPSSVAGWPLAINALKSTGGCLHVHENVNISELDAWLESTCKIFRELSVTAKKPMDVRCVHLEKVKSYAPKILHVVADLVCTPVNY